MNALLFTLVTAAIPPLVADIPPETDIAVRVDVGALREDAGALIDELVPALQASPPLADWAHRHEEEFWRLLGIVSEHTGADFERKGVNVTASFDLNALGGPVYSVVVRGALDKLKVTKPLHVHLESRRVDNHPAYAMPRENLYWAEHKGALVIGDERGMQRQLRRLLHPKRKYDEAIFDQAARLRTAGPVTAAFSLPLKVRRTVRKELSDLGQLLAVTRAGNLVARPGRLTLRLDSRNEDEQKSVAHGVEALTALTRGTVAMLEAGGQLMLGLGSSGKKGKVVPDSLDKEVIEDFVKDWLKGFRIEASVRARKPNATEVELEISSYRGLAAAGAALAAALVQKRRTSDLSSVEKILFALRDAQLMHQEVNGSFVSCGPVPRKIPTEPVDWPRGTCFERLAFQPEGPVDYQLEATLDGGKLVLVARSDPDGDGVPRVWYLDQSGDRARGFGRQQEEE